jgi:hypothetical protein
MTRCHHCYTKIFIRSLLSLDGKSQPPEGDPVKRKGNVFLEAWDGLVISRVEIRGIAIGITRFGEGGLQVVIDDGSGRVTAIAWNSTPGQPSLIPPPNVFYNKFVSVKGQLSGFRSELQLRIDDIVVIADGEEPTEECHWWLDVKEQWENLAASARSATLAPSTNTTNHCCPCLCHSSMSGLPTPCRTLGKPSCWPPSFVRAVAVLSSTIRALPTPGGPPIQFTLAEIIDRVKQNLGESQSLSASACYPDCATVEAVRELTRLRFMEPHGDSLLLRHSPPSDEITIPIPSPDRLPRYPMTPMETLLTQPNQSVIEVKKRVR